MTFLLRFGIGRHVVHFEIGKPDADEPNHPQGDVYASTERGYGSEDDDLQVRRGIGFCGASDNRHQTR